MNPALWLTRAARLWPGREALFEGETPVATYAEFAARAGALAASLKRDGIGPGERIALFSPNRVEYLIAMQAIWWIGAVAVPVNAKLHPREVAYILEHSGARMAISDLGYGGDLRDLAPTVQFLDFCSAEFAARQQGAAAPQHPTGYQDLIWLFYTSGTTGRPKGVMLSAQNIHAMVLSYQADVAQPSSEDCKLYAAPMSHGAGLYHFPYLIVGAKHIVPASRGFDEAEILDLARGPGNLCFFAAPTMVRRLVALARERGQDGSGFGTIIYGGGPMYLADIEEAIAALGQRFAQIYGQGETPMTISVLPRAAHIAFYGDNDPQAKARLASVGYAQAGCELAVLKADHQTALPGEIGEVAVRGPSVMQGYWQNPAATREAITEAGWLLTGDIGAMDAAGYLTLHDRSKDVIVSGGTNIYPREVEEALLNHPSVAEASVIGCPDPEWGESVLAFIVTVPGTSPDAKTLDTHCLTLIARFKRPKEYHFIDALPKNAYGKVLKTELRQLLVERTGS